MFKLVTQICCWTTDRFECVLHCFSSAKFHQNVANVIYSNLKQYLMHCYTIANGQGTFFACKISPKFLHLQSPVHQKQNTYELPYVLVTDLKETFGFKIYKHEIHNTNPFTSSVWLKPDLLAWGVWVAQHSFTFRWKKSSGSVTWIWT